LVESLAVLADGKLVSGGYDGTIKIWPKEGTGKPKIISRYTAIVTSLADGPLASGGADGTIKR
jgi:cytochrome c